MSAENFIITAYCLIDDELKKMTEQYELKLRRGGFQPQLTDSEVITMEIVAEFLSIDTDKGVQGLLIADKGLIGADFQKDLLHVGINLQTAVRSNMKDTRDPAYIRWLISTRRLVETVIGQLAGRFNIEIVRARKLFYFTNRI